MHLPPYLDINKFKTILGSKMAGEEFEEGVITRPREKIERPRLYKVLLHNDDYTTMEFVLMILQKYFSKSWEESQRVMLKVHHEGVGVCGVYTFEIAETKVDQVRKAALKSGYPLQCTFEED